MAKQQSILPEKIAKQKQCPLCECFFVPDVSTRFRCEGCEPVLGEPLNPAVRQLAEDLEKMDKAESVVEKDIPTRSEVEMMIRVIVKEELAAMLEKPKPQKNKEIDSIVGNTGPTSVVATSPKFKWKTKNCIKCEQSFQPRSGNQKKCDDCRAKGDK